MSLRFLGVAVISALLLAAPATAQDAPRTLTVTGEGRVAAAPDMATVRVGVVTEGVAADAAISANNARMAAVMERLTALGIAESDIQTSNFSVNPRWRRGPNGEGQQDGFEARNMVTVRVRDTDALGGVLDAVARDGANAFQGVTWGFADPVPLEDAARIAAVADAQRKAALFAEAAGEVLGPLLSLSEAGGAGGHPPVEMRMAMQESVPVAGGEVGVAMQVTLVYGLD